ncbi:uncharacterized protein PG986_010193 [Apiospora aurea]|uniref:Uncharacterized protein n=1 Tax=Apiospora aurea TaxID=335848 RepID=A0ABR1Q9S3_9PEZI
MVLMGPEKKLEVKSRSVLTRPLVTRKISLKLLRFGLVFASITAAAAAAATAGTCCRGVIFTVAPEVVALDVRAGLGQGNLALGPRLPRRADEQPPVDREVEKVEQVAGGLGAAGRGETQYVDVVGRRQ